MEEVGLTVIVAPEIFPGFHTYVLPPDAERVTEPPAHTSVCVAVTEGESTGPGAMVTGEFIPHPLLSVTATV